MDKWIDGKCMFCKTKTLIRRVGNYDICKDCIKKFKILPKPKDSPEIRLLLGRGDFDYLPQKNVIRVATNFDFELWACLMHEFMHYWLFREFDCIVSMQWDSRTWLNVVYWIEGVMNLKIED